MNKYTILFFFILIIPSIQAVAQNSAQIYGIVSNKDMQKLEFVNISILDHKNGVITKPDGSYKLLIPANKELRIQFSHIGYETVQKTIKLKPGFRKELNIILDFSTQGLSNIEIVGKRTQHSSLTFIDPKAAQVSPGISGGVEDVLITLPGVSSNNELSSQYSVRGGNFDENLIYVNGIEIYRPFLIRSGQQEGLSFVNSDMVSSILFSTGGFEARYGDKMSSVLDITYKKPEQINSSVSSSLLGYSIYTEGITFNKKLSYLLGVRQKTTRSILNNMEIHGEYKPSFTDIQSYVTYNINEKWELSLLGNYARNSYKLIPTTRTTTFGTMQQAYQLKIYFQGREVDEFETLFGAMSVNYRSNKGLNMYFTASAFRTNESESYDILGQYWIGEFHNNLAGTKPGEMVEMQSIGTYLSHARNYLNASVLSFGHRGSLSSTNRHMQWGLKVQQENIKDNLSEWEMVDSANYSLPHPQDMPGNINRTYPDFELFNSLKATVNMSTIRLNGFFQNTSVIHAPRKILLTTGLRANYWEFNRQLLLSPRLSLLVKPQWKKDITLRFSSGYYYQPPFYKELRNFQGQINPDIKAQKSIHFVAAGDLNFTAWERPFKFTTELYYKMLDQLIPYKIDNVQIKYLAENSARGYATGIDFKLNGQFVKGTDSWISLSLMKTQEDIISDYYWEYYDDAGALIPPGSNTPGLAADSAYVEPGYIPRPTDQRVNFSLFFQDYLPNNPGFKVHLRLLFGSSLPFGPPNSEKYQDTYRIPPYRRVDIGFSKELTANESRLSVKNPLRYFKSIWISAEIFNLFQINNTISYLWIKDVENQQYAVPNYLSPRQLNFKITARF